MTTQAIKKTIETGSTKKKILLYMNDIAQANITPENPRKLTEDQDRLILDSISTARDINYYDKLRTLNRSFIIMKPYIESQVEAIRVLRISLEYELRLYRKDRTILGLANEMLPDFPEEIREKRAEFISERLNADVVKKQGGSPSLTFDFGKHTLPGIGAIVTQINNKIKQAKHFIKVMETILKREIPLGPYKKWLKAQEATISGVLFSMSSNTLKEITDYLNIKLLTYDEIEVEIEEEDIEQVKQAGL